MVGNRGEDFLISVIIPTFNRSHTLGFSIESLLNQTSQKWELIIIDDGSTDGTFNLVNKYLKDNRIKYFYQTNQGVSTARNYGVSKAHRDYRVFLDSDDTFEPNINQHLYKYEISEFDLICWEVLRKSEKLSEINKPRMLGKFYNNITANFLAGGACYKKEVFELVGGYDSKITFGENYELGIRIGWFPNLKVKIINSPFLIYNFKTKGRTSNSSENRLSSYIYQMEKHHLLYSQNPRARSTMHYLIGFVLEQNKSYSEALNSYKESWLANPLNIKPLLKILYFKIIL